MGSVGKLGPGETVVVTECRDRKSDIELLTVRAGLLVVIAGDSRSLRLRRRDTASWSKNAVTSCRGFFESMSVVSMAKPLTPLTQ